MNNRIQIISFIWLNLLVISIFFNDNKRHCHSAYQPGTKLTSSCLSHVPVVLPPSLPFKTGTLFGGRNLVRWQNFPGTLSLEDLLLLNVVFMYKIVLWIKSWLFSFDYNFKFPILERTAPIFHRRIVSYVSINYHTNRLPRVPISFLHDMLYEFPTPYISKGFKGRVIIFDKSWPRTRKWFRLKARED